MNYRRIYDSLIIRGLNRPRENGVYYERHHILPRCMGGGNNKENLVYLTAREHFVVHQLLVKIYPKVHELVFAVHMMTVDNGGGRINNREYDWLKTRYSKATSDKFKGRKVSEETRKRMSEAAKLRMNRPEEKERVSRQNTGRKHTEESKMKIGLSSKSRKRSEESIKKQSERMTGKKHSKETLEKIRKAASKRRGVPMSEDVKRKMSEGWAKRKLNKDV